MGQLPVLPMAKGLIKYLASICCTIQVGLLKNHLGPQNQTWEASCSESIVLEQTEVCTGKAEHLLH